MMPEMTTGTKTIRGVVGAVLVCVLSLVVFAITTVSRGSDWYWADYFAAYHQASGATLVAGILWLVFALLKRQTNFFALDRKIGSDEFSISMAAIIIGTAVVLFFAMSNLPSLVPPQLPPDVAERAKILRMANGFKTLVASSIILAGIVTASAPVRRFFGK
jgi:hypothetical protein